MNYTKKNNALVGAIVGIVVIIVALIYYLNDNKTEWWATLNQEKTNHAYGIKLFKDLVKDNLAHDDEFFTINKPLKTFLKDSKKATYMYVCNNNLYFTDEDQKAFLHFIAAGNKAFIASNIFQEELLGKIIKTRFATANPEYVPDTASYNESENEYNEEIPVVEEAAPQDSNFYHRDVVWYEKKNQLTVHNNDYKTFIFNKLNNYKLDTNYFTLHSFNDSIQDWTESKIEVLATDHDQKAIYIKINYGKGAIYWWLNPWTLGNINLLNKNGKTQFQYTFKDFNKSTVYWEKFHELPQKNNSNPGQNIKSALAYILSESSLKWAWYLLLLAGILYTIFNFKRRQKQIPIHQIPENTTEEYLQTIAQLYQSESGSELGILRMKLAHIMTYIRVKYKITLKEDKDEFIHRVHVVSGVEKEVLTMLLVHINTLNKANYIDKEHINDVMADINKFYGGIV